MSKIIFVTPPAHGHLNPVLPVMQELVKRGEQVICYNNKEFRPQIERTGAVFRAYPPSALSAAALSQALEDGNLARPHLLMMHTAEMLTPFMLAELSREPGDLVVFDSLAIWGKIAANSLQLHAAATISHFVFDITSMNLSWREYLRMMGQFFSKVPHLLAARRRLTRSYGKAYPTEQPLFPMRDRRNLVFTTRALQPNSSLIDDTFRFVGPAINPTVRHVEFPFDQLRPGPVVYISLGTVHHGNTSFYKTCFEAFADHSAQFVLSVGKQTNVQALGAIPSNFIVRSFVPQLELLEHTTVFITHGGINSIHEGLFYGVPLILIPHQFEQMLNARCVAQNGAGLVIEEQITNRHVPATTLRQALEIVSLESSYMEKARAIQQSLQTSGGYEQAATELQAYLSEAQREKQ